jgi:hypothetical protein
MSDEAKIDGNSMSDIDDEELFGSLQARPQEPKNEKIVSKIPDSISAESEIPPPDFSGRGNVPELRGDDFPKEYIKMAERLQAEYRLLPRLNHDAIYNELGDLSVKASKTPTLQVVGDEYQKVQASKDRLSEILIDASICFTFKKRAVDILRDGWAKFSLEKSSDKRKGDSFFRLSNFIADLALTEGLLKACIHVQRNLDSAHERLSRTITIWQLTMKLGDLSRGGLPDFDPSPDLNSQLFNDSEIDPTEPIEPEEEDF